MIICSHDTYYLQITCTVYKFAYFILGIVSKREFNIDKLRKYINVYNQCFYNGYFTWYYLSYCMYYQNLKKKIFVLESEPPIEG